MEPYLTTLAMFKKKLQSTASTISRTSQKSGSSTKSRRIRYKLVQRTDSVDESLFGSDRTTTGVNGSTKILPKRGFQNNANTKRALDARERGSGSFVTSSELQKLKQSGDVVIMSMEALNTVKVTCSISDYIYRSSSNFSCLLIHVHIGCK